MANAEEQARRRGAEFAYLDTFSFQAPGFATGTVTRFLENSTIFRQAIAGFI